MSNSTFFLDEILPILHPSEFLFFILFFYLFAVIACHFSAVSQKCLCCRTTKGVCILFAFYSILQTEEFYVCIYAAREGDYILFHHEGGMDVGDVDAKAQKLLIGVDEKISEDQVKRELLTKAPNDKKA